MELLLALAYTAFFIFLIHKMRFFAAPGLSPRGLSLLLVLKILAGTALWALYTFYYTDRSTADIYKYFDDSGVLFSALETRPLHYFQMLSGIGNNSPEFDPYYNSMHYWARKADSGIYNDSHTIIRFNAFVRVFSGGYFSVHTVFMCFFSLIGLTAIYKAFVTFLADRKRELIFAVFLLPSVLFWGSGVLKEGLIFFALGLLVYYAQRLFSMKAILICLGSALLLALSKFYVWLAILPGIIFIIWMLKSAPRMIFLKFTLVLLLLGLAGINIHRFTGIQDPLVTLSQKQIEFRKLAEGNARDAYYRPIPAAGSLIRIPKLEPTLASFISNSPVALGNVLFRPFPWEMRSALLLLAGVENFLILFFILLCLLFIKPWKEIRWEYVLFCLSFVIIQFLIIGETTPVLGAVVRYKVPALPFLLIAFLLLFDKQKLLARFPGLKKWLAG